MTIEIKKRVDLYLAKYIVLDLLREAANQRLYLDFCYFDQPSVQLSNGALNV
jgi:hypothetical protein